MFIIIFTIYLFIYFTIFQLRVASKPNAVFHVFSPGIYSIIFFILLIILASLCCFVLGELALVIQLIKLAEAIFQVYNIRLKAMLQEVDPISICFLLFVYSFIGIDGVDVEYMIMQTARSDSTNLSWGQNRYIVGLHSWSWSCQR